MEEKKHNQDVIRCILPGLEEESGVFVEAIYDEGKKETKIRVIFRNGSVVDFSEVIKKDFTNVSLPLEMVFHNPILTGHQVYERHIARWFGSWGDVTVSLEDSVYHFTLAVAGLTMQASKPYDDVAEFFEKEA